MRHWVACVCVLGFISLGLAGCNAGYQPKQGVVVTGRLLKGGKPLEVPRQDVGFGNVELRLVPTVGGAVSSSVGKDGSFKIVGAGAGIAPGSYRVAVTQQDHGWNSDALQGAFSDNDSPITVEVPQDKLGRTFDLGVLELDNYKKKK